MSINWLDIKNNYVNGIEQDGKRVYPTLRELAEKHDIGLRTLATHSKKEDWQSEREIVSNKIATKEQQKTIEQISDKGVKFDLESFNIAQATQDRIKLLLASTETKVSEACMLIRAMKDNQAIAKASLGENPSQENHTIKVEIVSTD
jgi:outer membrane protein OmpA-like peptidoglycan-associated protein